MLNCITFRAQGLDSAHPSSSKRPRTEEAAVAASPPTEEEEEEEEESRGGGGDITDGSSYICQLKVLEQSNNKILRCSDSHLFKTSSPTVAAASSALDLGFPCPYCKAPQRNKTVATKHYSAKHRLAF